MRRAAFLFSVVLLGGLAAPLAAQSANDVPDRPNDGTRPGVLPVLPVLPAVTPAPRATVPTAPRLPASVDTVTIDGRGTVQGAGAFNAAAGSNNQQANAGVIASGAVALAFGSITQIINSADDSGGHPARVSLAAGAFAGSKGWLAVNGAAGADNQQANLAIMALGSESVIVSDLTLARTTASQEPMGENGAPASAPARTVAIGPGAFKDSSGIVQLSLVGGDRNTTANTFALLVAGSAGN